MPAAFSCRWITSSPPPSTGAAGALEGARADRRIPALARDCASAEHFPRTSTENRAGHRSARRTRIWPARSAGRNFAAQRRTRISSRASAPTAACIVYSSGTGGRPKGCVLTHENYLEQCVALTPLYPFWPGVRYLSILPTNHAIDFMVGFIGPFTCGAHRRASAHAAAGIYSRSVHALQNHLHGLVPLVLKNLRTRTAGSDSTSLPPVQAAPRCNALIGVNRAFTRNAAELWPQPRAC